MVNHQKGNIDKLLKRSYKKYDNESDNEENILNVQEEKFGRTALMMAIKYNNIELIKLLLKEEINLKIKDIYGKTILDYIIQSKNKEIIELFKKKNLFSKMIDSKGETIFMKLAKNIKDKETLELFF